MASQYRRRSLMLNTIAKVAQGNPTIITDSSSRRLKRLDIFGQSEQASTTGAQLLNLPTGTFTNEEGQSFKVNDDMTVDVNAPAFESGYHDVVINLETPIDVVQGQTNLRLFFDGNISSYASFLLVDDMGNNVLSISLGTSYTGIATKTGRATKFYYRQQKTGGVIAKGLKFMVSQSSITDYEPYTGGKPSPSPDYPQEIISKEVSSIIVSNGASESQAITLADPITLRGIQVTSDGNVTIDGQQYIADVITEKDGVIGVERNVGKLVFDGSDDEIWSVNSTDLTTCIRAEIYPPRNTPYPDLSIATGMFDKLKFLAAYRDDSEHGYCQNGIFIFIDKSRLSSLDVDGLKAFLKSNSITTIFKVENPTFEPLPEEIQAQYKALKSYYPNTVIQTGCWNEVTYSAKRGG